jgi:hypothetical protein
MTGESTGTKVQVRIYPILTKILYLQFALFSGVVDPKASLFDQEFEVNHPAPRPDPK